MMKEMLKKIVDAFVSNASKDGQISSDAIGTIASTGALLLALTFGLVGATEAKDVDVRLAVTAIDKSTTPWTTNVAEAACLFDGPLGDRPLPSEGALSNGAHRIVWDMNAQGLSNKSDKVVFVVSAEGTIVEDAE